MRFCRKVKSGDAEPGTRAGLKAVPAEAWIMLLAVAARLPRLFSRPLWYDEAFAVLFSEKGPSAMLYGTLTEQGGVAADVHPLGYYTLLWAWENAFGTSPASVRSLSLLLGLLSLYLAFLLVEELFDRATARRALFALALAPFPIHYAQEVRMYALLAAAVIAATLLLVKAFHEPGRWMYWIGFALCAAAAQYTHNLAFLYLVPLSITALFMRDRRIVLRTIAAGIGALLLYAPWLLHVPGQLARLQWAYWIERPGWEELLQALLHFTSALPAPDWALPPLLFFSLSLLLVSAVETVRAARRGEKKIRQALFVLFLALSPLAGMMLISQWQPVFLLRALLPAAMLFTVWLVWSLWQESLPGLVRGAALAMLGLSYALGMYGWIAYNGFPYAPFDDINAYLQEHSREGDVIVHSNKLTAFPCLYDDASLDHRYLADPPGSASDTLAPATQEVLEQLAMEDLSDILETDGDVWLVMFEQEEEEYHTAGFPGHPARQTLAERFSLSEYIDFDAVTVFHYTR